MVAAIRVEKNDPFGAHQRFILAVQGFDIFLSSVPPGPRFRDLVCRIITACMQLETKSYPGICLRMVKNDLLTN